MTAPRLSLIVPAFNEEALLEQTILQMGCSLEKGEVDFEVVIVNDGSVDATAGIADRLADKLPSVKVLHQKNQGIGGAFHNGAALATGEYIILWPADMPATHESLRPYLAALGKADVIVGVRRARVGYNPLMRFNALAYPLLVRLLFGLRVRDVNWIHAYRRARFAEITLTQKGIPMLAEALVRLQGLGATFIEIDVDMVARAAGVPSAARPRVMWRTLRGLFTFWRSYRRELRHPASHP